MLYFATSRHGLVIIIQRVFFSNIMLLLWGLHGSDFNSLRLKFAYPNIYFIAMLLISRCEDPNSLFYILRFKHDMIT